MKSKIILKIMPLSACLISTLVSAQVTNWSIESGLGYEDNVFHAPDHDYIDTSLPSTRLIIPPGVAVTPVEKDGLFIPLDLQVDLTNKIDSGSNFITEIGLDTKFMLDSSLSDASATNVNLDFGVEYLRAKKLKSKQVKMVRDAYIGAFISTHDQVYIDHDTGQAKNAVDKYNYQSIGLQGEYEHKAGKMNYMAGFVIENLNYAATGTATEYDHTLNKLILAVDRKLAEATHLKFEYRHSVRDYSKRYARNVATGTYSAANGLLNYTFDAFKLSLSHKLSDNFIIFFYAANTTRSDAFEAYNDYSKTNFSLRTRYKYSDKINFRAKIKTSSTDYDHAYNFEDNTRGSKENSGFDLDLKVEHKWHKNKLYYVELNHTDRASTDDRYDYTDNELMVGAKWEY